MRGAENFEKIFRGDNEKTGNLQNENNFSKNNFEGEKPESQEKNMKNFSQIRENVEKIFAKIQICSIAKREEEIFLPNEKNPVIFEK